MMKDEEPATPIIKVTHRVSVIEMNVLFSFYEYDRLWYDLGWPGGGGGEGGGGGGEEGAHLLCKCRQRPVPKRGPIFRVSLGRGYIPLNKCWEGAQI